VKRVPEAIGKVNNSEKYDCAVIGGGPAGMMAAGQAALRGARVVLFEKNSALGRKLGITGKGRCNVTNNTTVSEIIKNINGQKNFMYSALNAFSPQDTIDFFEKRGIRLKTERASRVFPESDKASDIVNAMRGFVKDSGVKIIHQRVAELITENGEITGVVADGGRFPVKAAVIATGGLSYPATGSTGDGYEFACRLGHRIISPRPSLVPLVSSDRLCAECEGLTLKNVAIKLFEDGNAIFEDFGEMLFTRYGVSGPIILSASAHVRNQGKCNYALEIDLKPALSREVLEKRLIRDFEQIKNKQFKNSLDRLLPSSLREPIIRKSGISPDKQVNSITREERRGLIELLKRLVLSDIRLGAFEEAVITAGGVDTSEINPKTMCSKIVKGLFFAGEVIDVDGYTGGYNLQIAFSTGYAAGIYAAAYARSYNKPAEV
jgi:predicted Rossmann fold flavoprotein